MANAIGLTPAHIARDAALLDKLEAGGADLFVIDERSRMPLWSAAAAGREGPLQALLAKAPDAEWVSWPDTDGNTPLHAAAAHGHAAAERSDAIVRRLGGNVRIPA